MKKKILYLSLHVWWSCWLYTFCLKCLYNSSYLKKSLSIFIIEQITICDMSDFWVSFSVNKFSCWFTEQMWACFNWTEQHNLDADLCWIHHHEKAVAGNRRKEGWTGRQDIFSKTSHWRVWWILAHLPQSRFSSCAYVFSQEATGETNNSLKWLILSSWKGRWISEHCSQYLATVG